MGGGVGFETSEPNASQNDLQLNGKDMS